MKDRIFTSEEIEAGLRKLLDLIQKGSWPEPKLPKKVAPVAAIKPSPPKVRKPKIVKF